MKVIIFGASGDLTRRKLMPALSRLWSGGFLPDTTTITGFARSDMDDEQFRAQMAVDGADGEFLSRLSYHRGDYSSTADFAALGESDDRLFYLSTPPAAYEPVIRNLGETGLAGADSRIVVEKPFGSDLRSARELNSLVRSVFDEGRVFRIDHYLGKETVQNIMVLRFANSIFEHSWSHEYIDHVQITVAESLDVGTRGGYYDGSGAIRDMVQNHMMHLLALVAMEPPVSLDADAVRNEKLKVLQALRPIPPECAANGVVRAQYAGYRQTEGVAADSNTETFSAFRAFVDNWRWEGVPFYLRTGKCLARRATEISIHFHDVPRVLFNRPPADPLPRNVLVIRVQPEEGIALEFQAKVPGAGMEIRPLNMDFSYREAFGGDPPEAYERLLLDAIAGDPTLFTRGDEVEAAWQFVDPVIEGCAQCDQCILQYEPGTWGPAEADALIQADGRAWRME
jgi:glucose-6-phosphate 1-dehydrogenase